MAVYLILMSISLYAVLLAIQTLRHSTFFIQPAGGTDNPDTSADDHADIVLRSLRYNAILLPLTMLPIILLSKKMAVLVDHGIATLDAPQAIGDFLVAVLVLSPEGVAAIQSALSNRLQRSMNIALGSALATIGLTIPAVLVISLVTGKSLELGLEEPEIYLLLFTLLVSIVNFNSERTNVLQGFVHLILFMTYIMLIFD